MALPSDLLTLLEALGRAFRTYHDLSGNDAILVGGGAVSILTNGAYLSGDLDIIAANDDALDAALCQHGFEREKRAGRLLGGWYFPECPRFGVESVSGAYFDGYADRSRVQIVRFGDSKVAIPPLEDMIADRLGQYGANPNDPRSLNQAKLLYRLGPNIDLDYLKKRVNDEQGDMEALLSEGWAR